MKKFEIALAAALIITLLFPELFIAPAKPREQAASAPSDIVLAKQDITLKFKVVEWYEMLFS